MNVANPFDFSDLAATDAQIEADTKGANRTKQQFTCIECNGSGLWQGGRRNVHGNPNCWTCGGKGYVLTDPRKLKENRIKRAQKKADAYVEFAEANADVIREIGNAADWSDYARSLMDQLHGRKPWSEKQLALARSMVAKLVARREARAQQRATDAKAAQVEIDLTPIREMFETAVGNGYKKPKYRAEGLVITRAPDTGSNPGALYVKDEEADYQGKVIGITFQQVRSALPSTKERLMEIAKDPLAAAIAYGRRTGRCACCGRELTNHVSIELGIGPICRERWGL